MAAPSRRTAPLPANWPTLRRAALHRDNHTCQQCGQRATHVDHIIGAHQGGTDHLDNLQALCRRCHDRKTGREARAALTARRARLQRPPEPHPGLRPEH